jgi:hypothetical protein
MATYILKWNPAISSYRMIDYLRDMEWCLSGGTPYMNWSVWDYQRIKKGDVVYMLKVGEGPTGVIAKGKVKSRAYRGEDWSGKGRTTYYVDFEPTCMISPDCAPILSTSALMESIPDFDWGGGHSGVMLTDVQSTGIDEMWTFFLHDKFGAKPKSKTPLIFVKPHKKVSTAKPADKKASELGAALYRYLDDCKKETIGYNHRLHSNYGDLMKTVAFLMNDAPDNPACLYSNLESAKSTLWRNYRYPGYLRNALESAEILNRNGAEISVSLEDLKGALRKREEFASYIAEAEEKANEGELMDDLRDLIDGFDLIAHGNMGSFHDSELLSILIDHEANHIELKLHMCNGSDEILEVRFEGHIEYNIYGDGDCGCQYLYGGYFYRFNNRIYLDLDPLGEISADHLRVISFLPAE